MCDNIYIYIYIYIYRYTIFSMTILVPFIVCSTLRFAYNAIYVFPMVSCPVFNVAMCFWPSLVSNPFPIIIVVLLHFPRRYLGCYIIVKTLYYLLIWSYMYLPSLSRSVITRSLPSSCVFYFPQSLWCHDRFSYDILVVFSDLLSFWIGLQISTYYISCLSSLCSTIFRRMWFFR